MQIGVIGGGASGLFVGGFLTQSGHSVTIFDGNEKCGKKLYITGKGRCNVTNNCDIETYLANVVNGKKFMFSAIHNFMPQDTINFFEGYGVRLKTERGGRVFPFSDKSSDIIKALLKHCESCQFKLNEKVKNIRKNQDKFIVETLEGDYDFDRIIVATGGKSYSPTGSSGDGYKFAKEFGHNIIPPRAALAPIKLKDKFCNSVAGLTLKNVLLKCVFESGEKEIFGELLFTHDGISGPIALSMSSFISGKKNINLSIDLKPALDASQLESRLLRDFEANKNKNISYIIKGLLPKSLVEVFLSKIGLDGSEKVNSVKKEERQKIIKELKQFNINFDSVYPAEAGIITAGGVDLTEINPKNMESKLVKGLYFIGEVLDIDCLTGGFNLQTAFSTAYACAKNFN